MRFKVGDRVKYVKKIIHHNVVTGGIFTITHIDENNQSFQYLAESKKGNKQWFKEEELQKVEYTFEDLRKSPIGTKIVFEKLKDEVLIRTSEKKFENECYRFYIRDLENLCTRDFGKIIKIEEPEYRTVYENESEILDEVEKRYLRGVIRPFRNRVKIIRKFIYSGGNASIDISIDDSNTGWLIELLPFPKNEMYKGMEDNKEYTIEELGL